MIAPSQRYANHMHILRKLFLGATLPILVLLAWHFESLRQGSIFPSISQVWNIAAHPMHKPESIFAPCLAFSSLTSLLRMGLGYALAIISAVPLGLLMGRSRIVREACGPIIHMVRVVCPIAWIPVAIMLLGATSLAESFWGANLAWKHPVLCEIQPAMVLIVAWGAFFPVLLSSVSSAMAVRRSLLESAWLMGATPWQRFRLVVLPHSLPGIVSGMRIGLGISWMVIVAAELYPGTRSGLGYTIWESMEDSLQYQYAFAAILYIMAIGLVMNGILWLLERKVGHWQAMQK